MRLEKVAKIALCTDRVFQFAMEVFKISEASQDEPDVFPVAYYIPDSRSEDGGFNRRHFIHHNKAALPLMTNLDSSSFIFWNLL